MLARKLIVGPLVGLTAVVSLMLGSIQGAGASTWFAVEDTATLVAKGVAAVITLEYECEQSSFYSSSVTIRLVQSQGRQIVGGQSMASLTCNVGSQSLEAWVFAQEKPFKQGEAVATTSAFLCTTTGCAYAESRKVISLRKG